MSWLSIALQGAKAFAIANPELTQKIVQSALDTGIQLHQQYEAQQADKALTKTKQGDTSQTLREILDEAKRRVEVKQAKQGTTKSQQSEIAPEHHAFSDSQNLPGV